MRVPVIAAVVACAFAWPTTGRGELYLTAELVPGVGATGIETYRITATSDLGNVVGFDFTDVGTYGIFGPLNQINPGGQDTIFNNLNPLFGADELLPDTQFLVSSDDVVAIHTKESPNFLHGAFSFIGDKQLSIGNSVPFLQIATPSFADIGLKGAFAIRRPNDEIVESFIDVRLADIPRGPAPAVSVLPVPVVIPEPVITPSPLPDPVVQPPVSPPVVGPVNPTLPPTMPLNPGPVGSPVAPLSGAELGQFILTAEVTPTVGRSGFDTYRLTATSNLGSVVGADFTKVNSYGISGPLGQVNSGGAPTIFASASANYGPAGDVSQDSQFLVNSDEVLSLFTEESESGLHGAFAFIGDKQFSAGQSLPFAQVSTADASAVNLKGSFVIRRANGELVETMIDMPLSAIAQGPAPVLELLPIPEPVIEPVLQTPLTTVVDKVPQEDLPQPDDGRHPISENQEPFARTERETLIEVITNPDTDQVYTQWHPDLSRFELSPVEHVIDIISLDFSSTFEMPLVEGIHWETFVSRGDIQVFTSGIADDSIAFPTYVVGAGRSLRTDAVFGLNITSALFADALQAGAVPEPCAMLLLLTAMAVAGCLVRLRKR